MFTFLLLGQQQYFYIPTTTKEYYKIKNTYHRENIHSSNKQKNKSKNNQANRPRRNRDFLEKKLKKKKMNTKIDTKADHLTTPTKENQQKQCEIPCRLF